MQQHPHAVAHQPRGGEGEHHRAERLRHQGGEGLGETASFGRAPVQPGTREQQRLLATTIQGVTEDLEAMRFNTAIAKLMVYVRDVAREAPVPRVGAEAFVKLLSPLAPHVGEELWEKLGHRDTIAYEPWPEADPAFLVADTIKLAVQVNGKRREPKDRLEAGQAVRIPPLRLEAGRGRPNRPVARVRWPTPAGRRQSNHVAAAP